MLESPARYEMGQDRTKSVEPVAETATALAWVVKLPVAIFQCGYTRLDHHKINLSSAKKPIEDQTVVGNGNGTLFCWRSQVTSQEQTALSRKFNALFFLRLRKKFHTSFFFQYI